MDLKKTIKFWKNRAKQAKNIYNNNPDLDTIGRQICSYDTVVHCLEQLQAIKELHEEYKKYGGGFHYQVGRVFDDDFVLLDGDYPVPAEDPANEQYVIGYIKGCEDAIKKVNEVTLKHLGVDLSEPFAK